jgi:hypothetical protein
MWAPCVIQGKRINGEQATNSSNPMTQKNGLNGRQVLIVSGLARSLLIKYDLQLRLISERIHSQFQELRASDSASTRNGSTSPTAPEYGLASNKIPALMQLDFETYITVGFDLIKVCESLGDFRSFVRSAVALEIIKVRTEHVRHAHKPSESNASSWIRIDRGGIFLRKSKRDGQGFETRAFQQIESDFITVRETAGLTATRLQAYTELLEQEAVKIQFPQLVWTRVEGKQVGSVQKS